MDNHEWADKVDTDVDANGKVPNGDKDDNMLDVDIKTSFNEDIHWKKQFYVLSTRFANPKQMTYMLCNCGVVNGY